VDEAGQLWRERGFYTGSKAFPASYSSLRPRAAECSNLLVPCCVSASHAAFGSVRMEPVFMMLGHAAGTAASLAVERNVAVQEVSYPLLRERLLAEKQILEYEPPRTVPAKPSEPATVVAPNDQLIADVKVLVDKKIVESGDYWLTHALKGAQCDGEQTATLLLSMARRFDPAATRDDALRILNARKVLASSAYWEERAIAVIRNFVRAAGK
jgi:FAD dependent oxidoreductase